MDTKRPWYKMKRFMIPAGLAVVVLASASSTQPPQPQAPVYKAPVQVQQVKTIQPKAQPTSWGTQGREQKPVPSPYQNNVRLSNDSYYTNTYGNSVHSPAYAPSIPAGASAQCNDGTYSFSQSRRGTCSHHGGVSEWY